MFGIYTKMLLLGAIYHTVLSDERLYIG